MYTVIQDDVLFTQKDVETELGFSLSEDNSVLTVTEQFEHIGELMVHEDEEMWEALIGEGERFDQEDFHYVYINNELVYLSRLGVSMFY
jgi:thermostable 8-oxoguanine DNA glycosylase